MVTMPHLEDDGDDVVADVSLPEELLAVGGGVGEEGRHVEHHLTVLVHRVHRILPGTVTCQKFTESVYRVTTIHTNHDINTNDNNRPRLSPFTKEG